MRVSFFYWYQTSTCSSLFDITMFYWRQRLKNPDFTDFCWKYADFQNFRQKSLECAIVMSPPRLFLFLCFVFFSFLLFLFLANYEGNDYFNITGSFKCKAPIFLDSAKTKYHQLEHPLYPLLLQLTLQLSRSGSIFFAKMIAKDDPTIISCSHLVAKTSVLAGLKKSKAVVTTPLR